MNPLPKKTVVKPASSKGVLGRLTDAMLAPLSSGAQDPPADITTRTLQATPLLALTNAAPTSAKALLPKPWGYTSFEPFYHPLWAIIDWHTKAEKVKAFNDNCDIDDHLFLVERDNDNKVIGYKQKRRADVKVYYTPFPGTLRYPDKICRLQFFVAIKEGMTHIQFAEEHGAPDYKPVTLNIGLAQLRHLLPNLELTNGTFKIIPHRITLLEENSNFLTNFDKVFMATSSEPFISHGQTDATFQPITWSTATACSNVEVHNVAEFGGLIFAPIPSGPRRYIPDKGVPVFQQDTEILNHADFHRYCKYDFTAFFKTLDDARFKPKNQDLVEPDDAGAVFTLEWKPEVSMIEHIELWWWQEEIDEIREVCEGMQPKYAHIKALYLKYNELCKNHLHVPYKIEANGNVEQWRINILRASFVHAVTQKQNFFRQASLVMDTQDFALQLHPVDTINGWDIYKKIANNVPAVIDQRRDTFVHYNAKFELLYETWDGSTKENTAKLHNNASKDVAVVTKITEPTKAKKVTEVVNVALE